MFLPTSDGICKFRALNKKIKKKKQLPCNENRTSHLFKQTGRHVKLRLQVHGVMEDGFYSLSFIFQRKIF